MFGCDALRLVSVAVILNKANFSEENFQDDYYNLKPLIPIQLSIRSNEKLEVSYKELKETLLKLSFFLSSHPLEVFFLYIWLDQFAFFHDLLRLRAGVSSIGLLSSRKHYRK